MNVSAIEWTDRTWNPVSGCSHVSEGCRHCYAERQFARPYPGRKFTDVQCHPERLDQPLKIKTPQKIFVNSMSDLFHEDVSDYFIADVFATMALSPRHTYQILTKRPARMQSLLSGNGGLGPFDGQIGLAMQWRAEHQERMETAIMTFPWPLPNVWLGVSVEDQKTADARIPFLMQTPAAVRWLSVEPLLGPVDLVNYFWTPDPHGAPADFILSNGIQWVVVGGESGPQARPMHPRWVRTIRDQCRPAGVPFFFKQWGEWAPLPHIDPHTKASPVVDRDGVRMCMVGKKIAGHLLDGREWKEFPK